MSAPVDDEAPSIIPPIGAGQLLSARERSAVRFREKMMREMSGAGPKRTSDLLVGYRHGWDQCFDFLRAAGAIR